MKSLILLSLDEGLPTEFRLFVKGWNETENGKFLFDSASAKAVMAAYAAWGVDLAIDLEHGMLEVEAGSADPTARDARGWCKLELRQGELWACDVKWTSDGATRLSEKRQRYISPAFEVDPKTKRILKVVNVAITAIPATHKTPALIAASKKGGSAMDPSLIKAALEAVEKGDAKAALEILKGLIASAAGADPEPDGDEDGSEGDGAEGVAPPAEAAVESPKVVPAGAAPPPAADDDEDDDQPAKKAERKAMRVMLRHLTGVKTMPEALAKIEQYRASHLTLETERRKLASERATLESAERRGLVVSLVTLGAEFPSTVWADDKCSALKARWARMPIAELRSHVAEQKAARGVKRPVEALRPAMDANITTLSVAEVAMCKEMGCDPGDYAKLKAVRDGETIEAARLRGVVQRNAIANVSRGGKSEDK